MKVPIQAAPVFRQNFANSNKIKTSGVEPQGFCFDRPNCPVDGQVIATTDTLNECCNLTNNNGSWHSMNPNADCVNCLPPVPPNSPTSTDSSSEFTFGEITPRFGLSR